MAERSAGLPLLVHGAKHMLCAVVVLADPRNVNPLSHLFREKSGHDCMLKYLMLCKCHVVAASVECFGLRRLRELERLIKEIGRAHV